MFQGMIRGVKQNSETGENDGIWGSHFSLNDIHVILISPSQMAVY
jgi:hypothetical protein